MKLIVGLGNPGTKYEKNRHNVGFMMLDHVRQVLSTKYEVLNSDVRFSNNKKFNADICEVNISNEVVVLVKPQTFMNRSGEAVAKITTFYKLPTTNLIVIHDDLDIRLGEYKIQIGKGPMIHNGLISIEERLGAKDFIRVRVGVDNRDLENRIPGDEYVLADFRREERKMLEEVFNNISKELEENLSQNKAV
ncbi:MAG TPA: aminoacyl-tRNA hydrolase [Candidatus Nitrosocosmicus sp.]|nr:aminoacyl-tRNA hydrolase [Candidatus Nitrosocosmicus sp.]